ncbi:hypothetical protein [Mucilaginibacter lappiensis]|uniref:hypothetical protein n=1 Tax=Mucilaginibacter lappiensis TaxID=354630 RepID=UPI003D1E2C53
MWRRIHSNRDPRDTLLSEIRKEFGTYFIILANYGKQVLTGNPRFFYWAMVFLMAVSMVLSFTVFRQPEEFRQPAPGLRESVAPVHEGFDQILEATAKIKETLRLKHLVDSITSRRSLTQADSMTLDTALSQLQRINTNH